MNKIIYYLNYLCSTLFTIISVIGFSYAYSMYQKHGFSYQTTTIINGEVNTCTSTLTGNAVIVIVFVVPVVLFVLNCYVLKRYEEREETWGNA